MPQFFATVAETWMTILAIPRFASLMFDASETIRSHLYFDRRASKRPLDLEPSQIRPAKPLGEAQITLLDGEAGS
jgi:hypothetical protein